MYDYFISFVAYAHDGSKTEVMTNVQRSAPIKSMDDLALIRKDLMEIHNLKNLIITFYSLLSSPKDKTTHREEI